MLLAADYPVLGVFWSMLIFFVWIAWFMLLFHIIGDVFRRRDATGATKTLWSSSCSSSRSSARSST